MKLDFPKFLAGLIFILPLQAEEKPDPPINNPIIAPLVLKLGAEDFKERESAATLLKALERADIPQLETHLKSEDPEIKARVESIAKHLKNKFNQPDPSKTITTASGLQYIDLKAGDGATVVNGDKVQVHYTGWLKDGKKFDSSVDRGRPFSFTIGKGKVIKGWGEGILHMKVGSKRKLIIPPHLGYGAGGAGGKIPPNSTLIFDVEIIETGK